jgi:hypothetical protein
MLDFNLDQLGRHITEEENRPLVPPPNPFELNKQAQREGGNQINKNKDQKERESN